MIVAPNDIGSILGLTAKDSLLYHKTSWFSIWICLKYYNTFCQIQILGRLGGSKEDENHKNYQQTQIIATLHEISHNTTSEHNYTAFVTEGITNYTLHIVMSTETLYLG